MKKSIYLRVILLITCFIITSIFIYRQPEVNLKAKNERLTEALKNIPGWKINSASLLEKNIADELKLDDYLNQSYSRESDGKDVISLYIGYYYTGGKIGAAHDPQVCFPGQGWITSKGQKGTLKLGDNQDEIVFYSTMIAEKGQEKELVLYWFQSYDKANPDTFSQKINSLLAKIKQKREDSAFIRITVSIGNEPIDVYKNVALDFVKDFYPVFLNYIRS
jgi:EpsI family protein